MERVIENVKVMDIEQWEERFARWKEKYFNKEIVNLKKHFTEKDFEIIKKWELRLKIKYTQNMNLNY